MGIISLAPPHGDRVKVVSIQLFSIIILSCVLQKLCQMCGQVDMLRILMATICIFHYSKVWTCEQETVFLFHVFFLFFTLDFLQKVWTGGQKTVFLIHLFFLSCTLQNVLQKVWTGGQALKILKI